MPESGITGQYLCGMEILWDRIPNRRSYPYNLPAFAGLGELCFHPRATFIVGENGTGKSTVLEAIATAWGFNAEGGSSDFGFATRETHSVLKDDIRLSRGYKRPKDGFFLRAESTYNLATTVEELGATSFGNRSLHEQSHGESFLAIFMNRFRGRGLYILDEPEAALSPSRQLAFLARMHQLIEMESQFIIATHSPIIMAYPDADILQFGGDGVRKVRYEETEHYTVTRDFMANPQRMLRVLMEE